MRERFIIQLQESTYQQQLHNFQPREKYLTTPKLSQNLPRFLCPENPYSCMDFPFPAPQNPCQNIFCTDNNKNCPLHQRQKKNDCLEIYAASCLNFCALPSCCTDCTDPYSTTSLTTENSAPTKQKSSWDLCPKTLGKRALLAALFPLSSLLRNSLSISSSQCVLHTTQCILL
jgi:hypothetical protein